MMFIELFVPKGSLAPERIRRLAERLGTVTELTEGVGSAGAGPQFQGPVQVFGRLAVPTGP
ncbi:hypothetical protein [Nocardiopsis synnemataformans]|uniref:hypothetical protein n=1 Tax=Nocardiopsis synnemataformans TaxID=61305 RepID=UPI003EB80449